MNQNLHRCISNIVRIAIIYIQKYPNIPSFFSLCFTNIFPYHFFLLIPTYLVFLEHYKLNVGGEIGFNAKECASSKYLWDPIFHEGNDAGFAQNFSVVTHRKVGQNHVQKVRLYHLSGGSIL